MALKIFIIWIRKHLTGLKSVWDGHVRAVGDPSHVLSRFSPDEEEAMIEAVGKSVAAIEYWLGAILLKRR